MLHSDAEESQGKAWNMIFPVLQVDDAEPELILGYDHPNSTVLRYKYEPNAGITLGDDGEYIIALKMVLFCSMADRYVYSRDLN